MANTVLRVFERFKARMERRTGKLIKNIRTDDGAEFKKEFLKYVEDQGIIKNKRDYLIVTIILGRLNEPIELLCRLSEQC